MAAAPPSISVLVPVRHEAPTLAAFLRSSFLARDGVEVVVVDGASSDGSAAIAEAAGVRVVRLERAGRALQMNAGAAAARGRILVFLHADTMLPDGWDAAVRAALDGDPRCVGGCFRRRFGGGSAVLAVTARLADWRVRLGGAALGDQVQFVRRETFERLGGFATDAALEDVDFWMRLRAAGRVVLLREVVVSSPRRFLRRGALWQTLADMATLLRWHARRRSARPNFPESR